jgi:hypothetical protein
MGLVYHTATITPTKQQLVEGWAPSQPWGRGRTIVEKIGEYRFDDPDGEVGVESMLFRCDDDAVVQVALTYRAGPLAGADDHLVGTTEHTVLGTRYVYDACADPVWAQTIATAVLTGGTQAQMYVEKDGERIDVPARVPVKGSGSAHSPVVSSVDGVSSDSATTVVRVDDLEIELVRLLGTDVAGAERLVGQVAGDDVVLAVVRPTAAG